MAFKFRLQRVLQIKELRESLLRDKLSQVARIYNAEAGKLREQERVYQESVDEMRERLSAIPSAAAMADHHEYMQGLTSRRKRQEAKVKEVGNDLDKSTADVVEAFKEKTAIEKLKDRHYKRYKKETERREQNQLDEIALNRRRKAAFPTSVLPERTSTESLPEPKAGTPSPESGTPSAATGNEE